MREIAPAVLRYQLLDAGPGKKPWIAAGVSGVLGTAATIGGAVSSGQIELALLSPFIGGFLGAIAALSTGPIEPLKNLHAVPVGIVPWGLILDPNRAPEPVAWSQIEAIRHSFVSRDRRDDSQARKLAIVTFVLRDERRIQASAEEGDWLVFLTELYEKLAAAAAAPPAGDIEGKTQLQTGDLPVTLALLRRADDLLESAEGRNALSLETGGYRTTSIRAAGEETRRTLLAAMLNGEARFDPGPLAVILAAKLHATPLLSRVLELILSPSPLLAAVSRAAAVNLGASLMTAGSLDETRQFVADEERAELASWMAGAGGSRA